MARHGIASVMGQIAREAQRAQKEEIRRQLRAQREAERQRRAAAVADEKERKRVYLQQRQADVAAMNADLEADVSALEGLLEAALQVDNRVNFEELKQRPRTPEFDPGADGTPEPPPTALGARLPPQPSGPKRLVPGALARWESEVQRHTERFAVEQENYESRERDRRQRLEERRRTYDHEVAQINARAQAQHAAIDRFRHDVEQNDPSAIASFFEMVLGASSYPDGFPQQFRVRYDSDVERLLVEYELATVDVVPDVRQYRHVKTRDEIVETKRPKTHVAALYRDVIAQIALRCMHEVFEADQHGHISDIVFHGNVDAVDSATGRRTRPTLIAVQTTRQAFEALNLDAVEPASCLDHLDASLSKKPEALAPVERLHDSDLLDAQDTQVTPAPNVDPDLIDVSHVARLTRVAEGSGPASVGHLRDARMLVAQVLADIESNGATGRSTDLDPHTSRLAGRDAEHLVYIALHCAQIGVLAAIEAAGDLPSAAAAVRKAISKSANTEQQQLRRFE